MRMLFYDFSKIKASLVNTTVLTSASMPHQAGQIVHNAMPATQPLDMSTMPDVIYGESMCYDTSNNVQRGVAVWWDNSQGSMVADLRGSS